MNNKRKMKKKKKGKMMVQLCSEKQNKALAAWGRGSCFGY
jgi:hypothetical protein